ncbi:MAG: DUF488 family protein [Patescibacteria group bacterium]|nr:DUF488 family protein [Patescibacteria group bacterium]
MIKIKRVYEGKSPEDGKRILIDRLWPRGLKKEIAQIDLWAKEIAPSTELRKKFGHREDNWDEFAKEYFRELDQKKEITSLIKEEMGENPEITFVYSAKDKEHNNAIALKDYLEGRKNV